MTRNLLVVSLLAARAFAAAPLGCAGSVTLGTFQLQVRPFSRGAPLPLKSVAAIEGGSRLIWEPVRLGLRPSSAAEVEAVLVPSSDRRLITLETRPANARAEWQLPDRPQVIALIFGPQGLSEGKIKSLVTHNQDLLRELADYAEQSSEVEAMVQQLADAEQAGGADAAMKGFSAKYGVDPSKLNSKTPSDQQAALLLKALVPAATAYDPLSTSSSQTQQSVGVAASLAGMFFGSPVGLAAGGAALLQNLKTDMFPTTEFRTAFTQAAPRDSLALCTKSQAPKSKTRLAYLWAYRVPELKKPVLSLAASPHLALGSKTRVAVRIENTPAGELGRAREWRLTPAAGGASLPVEVHTTPEGALEIDLSKTTAAAGDYQLSATWDWEPLPVAGTLQLRPYGDFSHVTLASREGDKLIAGNGVVTVKLAGADFEFLQKVTMELSGVALRFTPSQNAVAVDIDTAKPGPLVLLLTQSDGIPHKVPLTILPPNPKLSNLPIRVNVDESSAPLHLEGAGLDRIEAATPEAGEIVGRRYPLRLKVKGLEEPLVVPDAIEMVGPRPRIRSVQKSLSGAPGIEIGEGELPAGTPAGLVIAVDHLNSASRPHVELGCEAGQSHQTAARFAGPGAIYVSVDPGAVGYAGCRLTATVVEELEGRSDPFPVGQVVRLPHLEKFTLSGDKVGEASYAGFVEGRDLDVIEQVGWDPRHGTPVDAIPTPIPGSPDRQTLRVVLPWPAPGPHAFLYVWLRGAAAGRRTSVSY